MAILKMQRTQTAGNQDKFTFSTWIKKSLIGNGGTDNDLKIYDALAEKKVLWKAKNVANTKLDLTVPVRCVPGC